MPLMTISFLDNLNKIHKIRFYIYKTSLANRWKKMVLENQEKNRILNYKFTNTTYDKIDKVRKNLNSCVEIINQTYDKQLPIFEDVEVLDTDILNYLHEEFEIYGDRIPELTNPVVWWTKELHDQFLRLNELIHLHEDVIKSKDAQFANMALLFDYYPQELFSPILERDKLYLKADLQWGKVYLGYNTLGKDWLKVHVDNDIDVVKRGQVRPQKRFAAETWINFGPDGSPYYQYQSFEQWYLNLDKELQHLVPIDDLNQLCLGRFIIGEVILDQYFLSFDPIKENWLLPSGDTKKRWNHEIFSTFQQIIKIDIND